MKLLLMKHRIVCSLLIGLLGTSVHAETTEFCLDGEFNLGARNQGMHPGVDEFVPTRWCVVTEDDSQRVRFSANGKSNPDMEGGWTVALLPPDLVRIVNTNSPPDVEFQGAHALAGALRARRLDPRRFVEEHGDSPVSGVAAKIRDGVLHGLEFVVDLPLRGRVPVTWDWDWTQTMRPALRIEVDGAVLFRASGSWRELGAAEAAAVWQATPGAEPIQAPGASWPANINMRRIDVADGVYLVRGVRTGFQHLVADTAEGLVIADAPAGWLELHEVPPVDFVPGLGISGLSERFVDFLQETSPDRPIHAVALTHAHDDHAGGARAFAAAGADVYAPSEHADFLERALNRDTMPSDRLSNTGKVLEVLPVGESIELGDAPNTVRLVSIGAGPHMSAALGVHAVEAGVFFVSDLHVPRSEDDSPRTDRAGTECWFASWAVANLPADTRVLNSHSPPMTPVSRLANYLEQPACRDQAD
jgi:glyoxylase-like metal-dependent hydrolase (beta-lactamase superfamily II)